MDYIPDGRPIGIEFTHINNIDLSAVNSVLASAHEAALSPVDLAPLSAA